MNPRKIFFLKTFGCQMNEADSERLRALLEKRGWSETASPENAGVIFAMGCSVRSRAENRVLAFLSTLKPLKKKGVLFGLLGCTANLHAEKILRRHPYLDVVCGSSHLVLLPEKLEKMPSGEKIILSGESAVPFLPPAPCNCGSGEEAVFVPVTKGCENFCSYCIVPFARGRLKSRPPEEIISEISRLVRDGARHVMLLGQNVNEYGKDFTAPYDFADLLSAAAKIDGAFRLGFMTSHPRDTNEKILKVMSSREKILQHLHLPLQSGSDRILKAMNRKYTREDYLKIVALARRLMPGLSLTSDIIAGFPGETEMDFRETYELVKTVRFAELYIFKYSPRPLTAAARLADDVPAAEKERRHGLLLNLQKEISREITAGYAGKTVAVFVEGRRPGRENVFTGRTANGKLVCFESGSSEPGTLERVVIEKRTAGFMLGRLMPS